jgi:hypothetical protein
MTNRELHELLGHTKPPKRPEVDPSTIERGEELLTGLEQEISAVQSRLSLLGGFFDGDGLPMALIGAMGLSATELHSQLPALRQALRDLAGEAK